MKKQITFILAASLSVAFSSSSFAGEWRQDANGYWWQEDDNRFPSDTWKWIDGNNDGVSEYYYFDDDGYMAANTSIQGYTVNSDGAWTINGEVQTKGDLFQEYDAKINPTLLADMKLTFGELKSKYGEYETGQRSVFLFPYGEGEYSHSGAAIGFKSSPLVEYDEPDTSVMDWYFAEGPELYPNYVFYETLDQLNDNCKPITIHSSKIFVGLPEKVHVDYFEQFLERIGAENIKILNKEISHKYISRSGTTVESKYVIKARFVYDGLWFYVNGNWNAENPCLITTDTDVYPDKNEHNEHYLEESTYSRTTYEGYLMG